MPELGQRPISLMGPVHEVFREALSSAPALIDSARGDASRRELIASYYTNVLAFLEVHHEHEEADLFPLLIDRAPQERAKIDLAIEQHHQVVPLLAVAKTSVAAWDTKGDSEADHVLSTLKTLEEALSAHLDDEVEMLDPLINEHITPDDVGTTEMEGFKGDKIWLIYGLVSEHMTDDQRAATTERTPPPLQQWWDTVGQPAFIDMIAQVRQTA